MVSDRILSNYFYSSLANGVVFPPRTIHNDDRDIDANPQGAWGDEILKIWHEE